MLYEGTWKINKKLFYLVCSETLESLDSAVLIIASIFIKGTAASERSSKGPQSMMPMEPRFMVIIDYVCITAYRL